MLAVDENVEEQLIRVRRTQGHLLEDGDSDDIKMSHDMTCTDGPCRTRYIRDSLQSTELADMDSEPPRVCKDKI